MSKQSTYRPSHAPTWHSDPSFDAIVVGAGHNGMVTAGYLARAGLRVLVLEQRAVVGGLCTTEEIWPGYWAEPASQIAHGIEPRVYRDMRLHEYGLEIVKPDPYMIMLLENNECLIATRSRSRLRREIARFSEKDAVAWFEYQDAVSRMASDLGVSPLEPPPPVAELFARSATMRDQSVFHKMLFGSLREFLEERFESDAIKATLGLLGLAFNMSGPSSTSAYMLLHWAFSQNSKPDQGSADDYTFRGGAMRPLGGIGSITRAMAASLHDDGVTVLTDAAVGKIVIADGTAVGVELGDGRIFEAPVVVSGVEPIRTLRDLVGRDALGPEMHARVSSLKHNGSISKLILALNGTPRFRAAQSDQQNLDFLRSSFRIGPDLDYLERAYDDAKYGRPSREPILFAQCPTAIDPSLAPSGHHLIGITVFHAPYHLRGSDWGREAEGFVANTIAVLSRFFYNIPDIIEKWRFISPAELESVYGATDGSSTHGDLSFGRLWGLWPDAGWHQYRTAIDKLYLCGSGTWPGGAVTGASGHNAAVTVLEDLECRRSALTKVGKI